MAKKVFLIGGVIVCVMVAYLIWFAAGLDFQREAAQLAVNGSQYTGNFSGLEAALESSPLWMSFIPAIVGIVMIIMILRMPEKQ